MRGLWILLLSLLASATGCQAPGQPSGPTAALLRIPDYEQFIDASLTLLRECDLQPARVDRATGLIVSERTTGAQWFEWWRVDSQGSYQLLESSLHSIGRIVTVQLEPVDPPSSAPSDDAEATFDEWGDTAVVIRGAGNYRIDVRVDKTRLAAPQRQVTTALGALAIYSEKLPTNEGLRVAQTVGSSWVPLGRDGLLEAYLLARLVDAAPDVELLE